MTPAPRHAPEFAPGEVHLWWQPHADAEAPRARRARVDALLRGVLCRYLGGPPASLRFARESRGRPYLPGTAMPDFNLSDTEGGSLVVVGARGRLGVDLERVERQPPHRRLARRYFAAEEIAVLERLGDEEARRAFLRLWTAKEASAKSTGTGIFGFLPRWRFDPTSEQPRLHDLPTESGPASRWHHLRVSPAPGYTAVVACDGYAPTPRGFVLGREPSAMA